MMKKIEYQFDQFNGNQYTGTFNNAGRQVIPIFLFVPIFFPIFWNHAYLFLFWGENSYFFLFFDFQVQNVFLFE